MLNENTDGAKKEKERRKRKLDAEGRNSSGSMCLSPQETHVDSLTLFPHSVKFLSAQANPNKRQEIKEKRRKNEAETEDGKKHS